MISKLMNSIKAKNAPIVVGLDPMLSYIPDDITKKAFEEKGETLEGAAAALIAYNKGLVDAVYDLIPAVKPQIAMYEQFGILALKPLKKPWIIVMKKALSLLEILREAILALHQQLMQWDTLVK